MKFISYVLVAALAMGGGIALQKFVLNTTPMSAGGGESGMDSGEKQPLYWVAPMDKNYRRDKPGKSPMGMDLIPVYEEDNAGAEGSVKISPVVVNNLGVRVAPVTKGSIVLPIDTVGYVSFDENKLKHIHSRVDGWIEVLNVKSGGDPVNQGETLYELYSPSLVNAQEEYLAALRSKNSVLKKASEARLLSLGLSSAQIQRLDRRRAVEQRISVTAQETGIVQELNVREGMYIKPATEVMSVGSLDTVWIIAEVFERQSNWVKTGQKVNIQTDAYPERRWEGQVDYLYPVLDKKTRTLRVRVKVDNPDSALLPNMFTTLSIETDVSPDALSIPREALIKSGQHSRVVKVLAEGEYQSVLVSPGVEFGRSVQILDGLAEGDRVVTSAQFLIDSESNIDAELARLAARDTVSAPVNEVIATGTVKAVMADHNMLTITHDPIPAWEWPTMKMDFTVDPSVDISGVAVGEAISFGLKKTGDWDYLITHIGSDSPMAEPPKMDASEMGQSGMRTVHTRGTVKSLMLDMDMIEVVHVPIPEWEWPTMSMSFTVPEKASVPDLAAGDEIRFELTETEEGEYLITRIQKGTR